MSHNQTDFAFALSIIPDLAVSLFMLPLSLIELATLSVRLKARHEPEVMAGMAICAGVALLCMTHGQALSAALYPFTWFTRLWKMLFKPSNGIRASRERCIEAAREVKVTAALLRERKTEDVRTS